MTPPAIDPPELDEADLNALRALQEHGDRGCMPREVDVSFRGDLQRLQALVEAAPEFGFSLLEWSRTESDEPWLFLVRVQTADTHAIHELTATCLGIQERFQVEFDGWGCVAERGPPQ